MPVEIELTFKLPSALVKERLFADSEIVTLRMKEPDTINMIAEYYDSPSHELRRMRATLRRRMENGIPFVAFKMALHEEGRLLSRNIWEYQSDEVSVAIGTLIDMGAPRELSEIAQSSGFVPRGRFEYTRRTAPLLLPCGSTVEMNLDEGTIQADGKQAELSEVLFKLLYGSAASLENFVCPLEEKYGLDRELSGKYDRALRLIRSR